jgi:hypothetical protein
MKHIILTCALLSFVLGLYMVIFFLPTQDNFVQNPPVISGVAIMFISYALFAVSQHIFMIEKELGKDLDTRKKK